MQRVASGAGRQKPLSFPDLRDPHSPVHLIADQLEPFLRVIVEKFHPERIILFGSYAYGCPNEHSDVDLLVVRKGVISENQSNREILAAFWDVPSPRLSFTILTKTPERLRERLTGQSPFYEDIIAQGIELYAAQTV